MHKQNSKVQYYDVIGDLHGQADLLHQLLTNLGYTSQGGVYSHPERQAVFVGDLIDKGPDSGVVLRQVRAMVDAGAACLVVGNHELNWLRTFHEMPVDPDSPEFAEELMVAMLQSGKPDYEQLAEDFAGDAEQLADHYLWLKTQPLWIDEPELRAVHACWDEEAVAFLRSEGVTCLDDRALDACLVRENDLYYALDLLVAGCEHLPLPQRDRSGFATRRYRVRWWDEVLPDYEYFTLPVKKGWEPETAEVPVFFGHYGLRIQPRLVSSTQVCVDFGVAYGGPLVAFSHQPGQALASGSFKEVR